eukprot:2478960-Rhodomonas_salina.5
MGLLCDVHTYVWYYLCYLPTQNHAMTFDVYYAISLHDWYTVSGTDTGHGGISLRACYAMSGTE